MPLVRIDVPAILSPDRITALSNSVHEALVETVDVPPLDRFQVISRHAPEGLNIDPNFLGITRGAEAVVIAITFRHGRSDEKKRALYRAIAQKAAENVAMRPADLMIVLNENSSIDWSFGEGIAQYAPGQVL